MPSELDAKREAAIAAKEKERKERNAAIKADKQSKAEERASAKSAKEKADEAKEQQRKELEAKPPKYLLNDNKRIQTYNVTSKRET